LLKEIVVALSDYQQKEEERLFSLAPANSLDSRLRTGLGCSDEGGFGLFLDGPARLVLETAHTLQSLAVGSAASLRRNLEERQLQEELYLQSVLKLVRQVYLLGVVPANEF